MNSFDASIVIISLLWVISLALDCPNRNRRKVWLVSALLVAPFPAILITGGHLKSRDAAQMEPKTPVPCSTELLGAQQRLSDTRGLLPIRYEMKAECPYTPLVGDVLENTVADEVAVGIVERLEVIYVHEEHGEGALASGLSTDQPL